VHLHFFRQFVPFLQVTGNAGGDDVGPFRYASPGLGDKVVTGQVFGIELLSAILTGVVIPEKDVPSGKLHFGVVAPDKGEKTYDGRLADRYRDAPDLPVILLEIFDLSQVNKSDRLLP
jgi:hypothetical protein